MSTATVEHDPLLDTNKARAILGVSRQVLERLVSDGRLSVVTVPGAHRKFPLSEVQRLREESTRPARAAGK